MDFEITEERILEVAKRYNLTAEKSEEPGFHINGKKISSDDLFSRLFEKNIIQEDIKINNFPKHIKVQKQSLALDSKKLNKRFKIEGDGVA